MPPSDDSNAMLEDPWMRRSLGLSSMESVIGREISAKDVKHLLDRRPYLQIANSGESELGICDPVVKKTDTGWTMHDYFDAISAGPGDFLDEVYIPSRSPKEEGGEGSGVGEAKPPEETQGAGTLKKQSFETAAELVAMVKERGWEGINMASDNEFMLWATWVAGQENGIATSGFEPSDQQKEKYDRIKRAKDQGLQVPDLDLG